MLARADAGTLGLGIIRDVAFSNTNDAEIFAETFEGLAAVGLESVRLTMSVEPSGVTSNTTTPTAITTPS
jgi:NifB/MoaA-like Fe-S oxidoreductase